ncbi:MAG TPA: hypothetical protein VN176_18170 [Verrucomicrobiae bacterium]|nr:hypothetical protein [Verrucomicrobiae bacterium]
MRSMNAWQHGEEARRRGKVMCRVRLQKRRVQGRHRVAAILAPVVAL